MSKNQKPKADVYIDGANMFYAQQKMGWFVDWQKVKLWLEKQYQIELLNYYIGVKDNDHKSDKFLSKIKKYGYKLITKPLKKIKVSPEAQLNSTRKSDFIYKANFDVEIAFNLALTNKEIAAIYIFSGDSDFAYALNELKKNGYKILVCASKNTLSRELRLAASHYILLEDIKQEIELEK